MHMTRYGWLAACALSGSCPHTVRAEKSLASQLSASSSSAWEEEANVQPNLSFTCISLLHSCLPISLSLEVPSLSWELEHALFLPLSLPCLCVLIYSFKLGLNGYPASYEGDTRYIENDLLIFWMCLLLSSPSPPQTCPV